MPYVDETYSRREVCGRVELCVSVLEEYSWKGGETSGYFELLFKERVCLGCFDVVCVEEGAVRALQRCPW